MIHGIRDVASPWYSKTTQALENEAGTKVIGVRFGYYNVLSFLAPIDMTQGPFNKLLKTYDSVRERYPRARVSVIGHSFGTYLLGRLLLEKNAKIWRIILCGSVLRSDFPWSDVVEKLEPDFAILNECGKQDPFPNLAKALSSRYGNAGTHGFDDNVYARDVHFSGGHSLFFAPTHIRQFWRPFLASGVFPKQQMIPASRNSWDVLLSIPFAAITIRIVLWIVWLLAFFWPITFLGAGVMVYRSVAQPTAVEINLEEFIENVQRKARDYTEPEFEKFLAEQRSADVNVKRFEAIILDVGSNIASDGTREFQLAPADCSWADSSVVTLSISDRLLPQDVAYSKLLPRSGSFTQIAVVAELENILWMHSRETGMAFFDGKEFTLKGKLKCDQK